MKKTKYKNWTNEQVELLIANYGVIPIKKLSQNLNKSIGSIYYILKKEKIDVEIRWWSKEEEKKLKELYPSYSNPELEDIFSRSEDAIQLKAATMKLKKNSWWSEDELYSLKEMVFEKLSYLKMAKTLNRTKSSIHNKLIELGFTNECRRWTDQELDLIKQFALSGENTYLDIAMNLNATPGQIYAVCKYNKWKDNIKRTVSYGNDKMLQLLKKIFPNYTIKQEYHIGERLRLDVFVKELNLGWEYDGIQHFRFTPQWHKTKLEFIKAQKRDERKNQLCLQQGITLIRIKYDEDLTPELIYNKLNKTIKNNINDTIDKKQKKIKAKIQNRGFQKSDRKYKWPTRKIQSRPFPKKKCDEYSIREPNKKPEIGEDSYD